MTISFPGTGMKRHVIFTHERELVRAGPKKATVTAGDDVLEPFFLRASYATGPVRPEGLRADCAGEAGHSSQEEWVRGHRGANEWSLSLSPGP